MHNWSQSIILFKNYKNQKYLKNCYIEEEKMDDYVG